jgi:hypothetical protein
LPLLVTTPTAGSLLQARVLIETASDAEQAAAFGKSYIASTRHKILRSNQTCKEFKRFIEEKCQLQPYVARIIASKTPHLAYNRIIDQFPFFSNDNNKNSHIRNVKRATSFVRKTKVDPLFPFSRISQNAFFRDVLF